ncbi:fumarylacetoacetate hydrolase family protein [Myxococcota bacterium]|nr:fumarylacetoacetate hydrolase family protein [Myxococcota bacterium]MBU1537076.1 fumarylacetoacetate hydrolase family protein [Myxococcota bacterium]
MILSRRRVGENIFFLNSNSEGKIQGISQSLPMLLSTGGLGAHNLMEKFEKGHGETLTPCTPSKIVCVGLNYRLHAEESGKPLPEVPLIFLKPTSALLPHKGTIVLPPQSSEVHFEGELAVVMGKEAKNIKAADAHDYILGYTIMNDVTARDIQRREKLYTRSKGFDTFAPLGPSIVTGLDPDSLTLETSINGIVKQKTRCDDMIFGIPRLIEFISQVMTLYPQDVISTGTPSGVGPLSPNDTVTITISSIGTLENHVIASSAE